MADIIKLKGEKTLPTKPVVDDPEMTVTLSKYEVTFRRPVGRDVEVCGSPVLVNFLEDPPGVKFDAVAMTRMIARLAEKPRLQVKRVREMDSRDWHTCAWSIAPWFMPRF